MRASLSFVLDTVELNFDTATAKMATTANWVPFCCTLWMDRMGRWAFHRPCTEPYPEQFGFKKGLVVNHFVSSSL